MQNIVNYITESVDAYRLHQRDGEGATMYLKNWSQMFLWRDNLCGQISDGAWENTKPLYHWIFWANITPKIGNKLEIKIDRGSITPVKNNYNFKSLYKYVEDELMCLGKVGRSKYAERIYNSNISGYKFSNIINSDDDIDINNFPEYVKKDINVILSLLSKDEIKEIKNIKYTKADLNNDINEIEEAMNNVNYNKL